MNLFATVNHGIHLACVIFWIGGLAFQLVIMAPFVRSDTPPPAYLVTLSRRFSRFVGPVILILMVTGGVNIGARRAGHDTFPQDYTIILGIKVLLVALVAALHFFGMLQFRRDEDSHSSIPTSSQWSYAKLSFLLGIVIIFIASMLRHWQF